MKILDVLKATPYVQTPGTQPHRIALLRIDDPYMPYVTGWQNEKTASYEWYWGHYKKDIASAVRDYEDRVRNSSEFRQYADA